MKKYLFFLFTVLCTLSLFSCSDDDNKDGSNPDEPWKQISNDYSGDKLDLQLGGTALTGKTVTLEATSADRVKVTLEKVLPGTETVTVDATLTVTKAEVVATSYLFQGETKVDSRTLVVNGSIKSGVLSLSIAISIDSPIVGKWALAPNVLTDTNGDGVINEMDYNPMGGAFFLSLETADGNITFEGQSVPCPMFCLMADKKAEAFLEASLQEVSFEKDGRVVFTYMKDGQTLPLEGIANYYVKEQMLYMTLDIKTIIAMLMTKSDNNPFAGLEQVIALAENGIPLGLAFSEDGQNGTLLINTEMAQQLLPALAPVFQLLPTLMPDEPEKLAILEQIATLAKDVPTYKEFIVGMNLVKK